MFASTRLLPALARTDERAFLPAAIEILETPPNPLGRALALAISAAVLASMGWATFGRVDIVAVASGKIVPHLRTQVVQPIETSAVRAVLVRDGEHVSAGQMLIELDSTAAVAERERARTDLVSARLDELRLAAFIADTPTAPFQTVPDATAEDRARAQAQLHSQLAARASQLATLDQERVQKRAEKLVLQQTSEKIAQVLPLVAERANIRKQAASHGASVLADIESQQLVVETRAELEMTRSRITALDAAIRGLDQKMEATAAELRSNALADLSKSRDRAHAAEEALVKAGRRADLQALRANVDGTVQHMQVVAAGTVVTPAQQLLSIVPDGNHLEIEALLENRDAGFVAAGQSVELKVDAFPFTRYGLLRGTVLSVDRDAEASPVNRAGVVGSQRAADESDRIEASERLRYTVHIGLEPGSLDVDGRPAELLPGMAVKAEILTGKRRIIDFLLSPLRETLHDAIRER